MILNALCTYGLNNRKTGGLIPGRAEILLCITTARLDLSMSQLVLLSIALMAMGHDTNH